MIRNGKLLSRHYFCWNCLLKKIYRIVVISLARARLLSESKRVNINKNKLALLFDTTAAMHKLSQKKLNIYIVCHFCTYDLRFCTWLPRAVLIILPEYAHMCYCKWTTQTQRPEWLILVTAVTAVTDRKLKSHVLLLTLHGPSMYLHSDITERERNWIFRFQPPYWGNK